ncbi:MAG TPA: MBL fold metallo-hydrolase [Candidatus Paceibacterota bacterium]|jgi:Predicted metal-dependent RNase, consists of a metallo-beta-lactamase domain and an RNA-binding KH domain
MKGCTLTCCSGVGNATGANFLVRTPHTAFLVDCGLIQGSRFANEENREDFPYTPSEISFLLVTHAHMDHVGRIPKLVKEGFSGTIYSTEETKELAALMLEDAQGLLAREAREHNVDPLYGRDDIAKALSLWKILPYHEQRELAPGVSVFAKDAGHILGSTVYEVTLADANNGKGAKIAFTGDLGNSPTPLLRDTEFVTDADYMVMESVYGDRNHEPKAERDAKLERILKEAISRGGTVVIPAFSLERTQVILYEINGLVEGKRMPQVPVFLDSPLAIKVTDVYRKHTAQFNDARQKQIGSGDDIFDFPGLRIIRDPKESATIDRIPGAKIIIAGSGMSVGGRILSHEATFLGDPNATILLVGYQVPGSLGRQIEEKVPTLSISGQKIKLRSHIEKISGYSSHKDSNGLVDFVAHAVPKLKQVFVAMGENKSSSFLAQRLRDEVGANAIMPEKNREYRL